MSEEPKIVSESDGLHPVDVSTNFEALVEQHKDAVYRQLVRVCGNQDDAEDALVESLLAAYKAADQLRDKDAFRGWLASIGRRVCMKIRKHDRLAPIIQLAELDQERLASSQLSPEDSAMLSDTHRCVKSALDRLDPKYAEVYQLVDLQEYKLQEAADSLGITLEALKSRLHRARAMMRDALDVEMCF